MLVTCDKISAMRNEATLVNIIEEARLYATRVENNSEGKIVILPLQDKRVRATRLQPSESQDDPVVGALNILRINFYYMVIDCVWTQLRERFYGEKPTPPLATKRTNTHGGRGRGRGKQVPHSETSLISEDVDRQDDTAELLKDIAWLSESRLLQVQNDPYSLPSGIFSSFCNKYKKFLNVDAVREQNLEFICAAL